MAENSNIEWTHHTFNPWIGCIKKTEACKFCYAEEFAGTRLSHFGKMWGPNSERHETAASTWQLPPRWNRIASRLKERHRVFCASLADVFEDNDQVIEKRIELWQMIRETPWLDWLILTKRPENFKKFLPEDWGNGWHNVWLGTSIGWQKDEKMIDDLLSIPAVVHFLSMEPLIGPVDASKYLLKGIEWVIVGGESGNNARECNIKWILSTVEQCKAAKVPVFVKQLGANSVYVSTKTGKLKKLYTDDKKGGNIEEFPHPLRVRMFPTVNI
jgi:protein gp37